LFESDEHGQRGDQLELGVAERVANGRERSGAIRLAFLGRGRVHEQANARHERRGDGHADETASGEHAGQQLRGLACKREVQRTRIKYINKYNFFDGFARRFFLMCSIRARAVVLQ